MLLGALSRRKEIRLRRFAMTVVVWSVALSGVLAGGPARASMVDIGYCAKVTRILDTMNVDAMKSSADVLKKVEAGAKALRASNPPAKYKKAIADYALVLDKEAAALKRAKPSGLPAAMAVVEDPQNLLAKQKLVLFVARNCH